MITNALSIDLEDWFHAELVRSKVHDEWPERRVEWAVEPILTLLERYDVKATFFIVGDVVRHHPALVKRLYAQGHEIACHGWSHRPLWSLDPERFAWELDEYDRDMANLVPLEQIVGFRAPTFSLDERTCWALDILRAHGYRYDSSVFPVRNYLYGVDNCPLQPYKPKAGALHLDDKDGVLIELPLSAYPWDGVRLPVSGGFYLRAWPWPLWRYLLGRINAQGQPFVIYLHPWEGDTQTPRVKGLGAVGRLVTYYNQRSVLPKLEALLREFRFSALRDVLGIEGGRLPRQEVDT